MKYNSTSISIVLILFGLGLLVPAFWTYKEENYLKKYENWVESTAKITDVKVVGSSTSTNMGSKTTSSSPIYNVYFSYSFKGKEFYSYVRTNGAIQTKRQKGMKINEELLVRINPKNPNSATVLPAIIGSSSKFFFYSISLIFLGIVSFIYFRKKKQNA